MSTTDGTPTGVLATVNEVGPAAVFVSVKNAVVEDSGLAFTSIVAPAEGRLAVIVTVRGKVGPGAAACTLPLAGVVVTVIVVSLQLPPPPPPPFLQ